MWDATLPANPPYSTLLLAVRDMRRANGRNEDSGDGDGNAYWGGLLIGFAVLDILTRQRTDPDKDSRAYGAVRRRWERLYRTRLGHDFDFVWRLRNSVVHSYFIPGKQYRLDNDQVGPPVRGNVLSVPLFCRVTIEDLVEQFESGVDQLHLSVW